MPMIPSPLAAVTYIAIKVVGYRYFAIAANKKLEQNFPPMKFAAIKLVAGFLGGLIFLVTVLSLNGDDDAPELLLYCCHFVSRFLIWLVVLAYCFKLHQRPKYLLLAGLLGTLVSYSVDLLMWILFEILPGMEMGFC